MLFTVSARFSKRAAKGGVLALQLGVLLGLTGFGEAGRPTTVTTTVVHPEGDIVSVAFYDGLGRVVQNQSSLNALPGAGDGYNLTSGVYRDAMGRDSLVTKAAPLVTNRELKFMATDDAQSLLAEVNSAYGGPDVYTLGHTLPDASGFAFSENRYYPDPLGRPRMSGAPGIEYSLNDDAVVGPIGRYEAKWYFGTCDNCPGVDANGFKPQDALAADALARPQTTLIRRFVFDGDYADAPYLSDGNIMVKDAAGDWAAEELGDGMRYALITQSGDDELLKVTDGDLVQDPVAPGDVVEATEYAATFIYTNDGQWAPMFGPQYDIQPAVLAVIPSSAPTDPIDGALYWDENAELVKVYSSSNGAWSDYAPEENDRYIVIESGSNSDQLLEYYRLYAYGRYYEPKWHSVEIEWGTRVWFCLADGLHYCALLSDGGPARVNPLHAFTHRLTVTMNPDGDFRQDKVDNLGNVVMTWVDSCADVTDDQIVAKYEYEVDGQVRTEIPPAARDGVLLADPVEYTYRTSRKVARHSSPDGGSVYYAYNGLGTVQYEMSALDSSRDSCVEYAYDDLGRIAEIRKIPATLNGNEIAPVAGGIPRKLVRNLYDNIDALLTIPEIEEFLSEQDIRELSAANISGRLVAEIAYDENPRPHKVIDIYGYNSRGAVSHKYKIIPGLQNVQKSLYEYDNQDKLISVEHVNGTQSSKTVQRYDSQARLSSLAETSYGLLVDYGYSPIDQLISREFAARGAIDATMHVAHTYNARDWLISTKSGDGEPVGFTQQLEYAQAGEYGGNIGGMTLDYRLTDGQRSMSYDFVYDGAYRLTNAAAVVTGLSGNFDEEFGYDQVSRFLYRKRGLDPKQEYDHYNTGVFYATRTNRLASVAGYHDNSMNYAYDLNGNMILDKTKKMAILYDWRNLPVAFIFYDQIPGSITIAADGSWSEPGEPSMTIDRAIESAAYYGTEISRVTMLYDAQGNRVYKVVH